MKNLNKIRECISEVLEVPIDLVLLESSNHNFIEWDSFGQVAIATHIENQFGIVFTVEEIFQLSSVKEIYSLVNEKLE
jgi:acyl carrier protein